MKFTEEHMQKMGAPLSASAEAKCKEAITNTKEALKRLGYTSSDDQIRRLYEGANSYFSEMRYGYSGRKIKIFTQGSYANDTNIQSTSDVDIAIVTESTFMWDVPKVLLEDVEITRKRYGFDAGTDNVTELKDEVESALRSYFGSSYVERRNKSVKVFGNTVRSDTDAVPAMRNRDYSKDTQFIATNFIPGIYIKPDVGSVIVNYPEQHIENGIKKNGQTNYNFKKCVRVAKNIREIMKDNGYTIPDEISSFGIESLLWNASNDAYNRYTSLRFIFDEVLKDLETRKNIWINFKEANGIKDLFADSNMKNKYISFFNNLRSFYEYV